uniref:C-type lectin domain-containing protein n=1 Tax=Elaeophora elaphi TaxID=1147741 RepID=A0A0R3RFE0_9BILA
MNLEKRCEKSNISDNCKREMFAQKNGNIFLKQILVISWHGQNSTSHRNALAVCAAQNSFLTSIINSAEMEFISEIYYNSCVKFTGKFAELAGNDTYLIGLLKDGNEWYWIDNYTELNYTNWRILEPNGCCGTNVKCAAANWNGMTDGQWNDIDCEDIPSANFVCKKSL